MPLNALKPMFFPVLLLGNGESRNENKLFLLGIEHLIAIVISIFFLRLVT